MMSIRDGRAGFLIRLVGAIHVSPTLSRPQAKSADPVSKLGIIGSTSHTAHTSEADRGRIHVRQGSLDGHPLTTMLSDTRRLL